VKNPTIHIPALLIMLLTCAGACSKRATRNSVLDLNSIGVDDTIAFDLHNLKLFPQSTNSTNGDYGFSYSDRSFFYVKTLNENAGQYAVVKCDLDNKEIAVADISTYVADFTKMVTDSSLCKSDQSCYGFDLETFDRSVVLTINFSGEVTPNWNTSHIVVFDPHLKPISSDKTVDPEHYLAETKIVTGTDSLFLRDLKGTELVGRKSAETLIHYRTKFNESILCDRHKGVFYKSVVNGDTLSIYALPDKGGPIVKFHGAEKNSAPLFIHNDMLFLSHHGNLYKTDLRLLASTGYKITPETYNVYPNSAGFFCDYPAFEDPGGGFKHAYSFIPFTDSK